MKDHLHFLTSLTAGMTVILLTAGALVTGTGSGLAVPDWPLSFGQFFPPMVGGVFFEHGHRLIAGSVALLTVIQAIQIQCFETRTWVKRLAWIAVAAVLTQAVLGGITVLWRLPTAVSVTHACLAQIFFSTVLVLSLATSKGWKQRSHLRKIETSPSYFPLPVFSLLVSMAFFVQLAIGATMRHTGAGLAIPDFPSAFGGIIPPEFDYRISIHFAHRVGAFALVLLTAILAARILIHYSSMSPIVTNVGVLTLFVSIQIMMGAMVIWFRRPVQLTTPHLVLGALCLGTSVLLTVQSFRYFEVRWRKFSWGGLSSGMKNPGMAQ